MQLGKSAPPFQAVNPSKIKQFFTPIQNTFEEMGGKWVYSSKPHPTNPDVLGTFKPGSNTITLYPGHNSGTIAEELLHFEQARRLGYIGKTYEQLAKAMKTTPSALMQRIEKNIESLMLRGGFRKTQPWELQ